MRTIEQRRNQRQTLRALDRARSALDEQAKGPVDEPLRDQLYETYHEAVQAYWTCHKVRNSKRARLQVTE